MGRKRGHVLWCSAWKAHYAFCDYPRTSSPVIVALLRSAFQALNTHGNENLPSVKFLDCCTERCVMGRERGHVLWRSAFQAHRSCTAYPRTSSPVTVATLRSAFQALNTHGNEICTASSFWTAVRNVVLWGGKGGLSCGVVPSRHIGLAPPIRGLRPRLPSLCSVVPSRHLILLAMKFAQRQVWKTVRDLAITRSNALA